MFGHRAQEPAQEPSQAKDGGRVILADSTLFVVPSDVEIGDDLGGGEKGDRADDGSEKM